jgi:hypothetical protein
MKDLSKILMCTCALGGGIAVVLDAQITSVVTGELALSETFVESRSGGKNFAAYTEHGGGFPDTWSNSTAKSSAPGLTAGVGSRFNSNAGFGAWFQVSPTLPTAGGTYEVYVTVTSGSGAISAPSFGVTVTGGSGLPATTGAFGVSASQPGNAWNLVGTLILSEGVSTPTIRFSEATHDNRFYADGVAFVEVIPEPSTYAAIFGGLALMGALVYRRRMNAKK